MHLSRFALLVMSLSPALWAAPPSDDPVVFACLKSETYVGGSVVSSAKQAASQIFDSIGIQLLWSCDKRTARNPIFIRLAAYAPKGLRKGTLAYALPFARQGVRITAFYDRLEPILQEHLSFAGSIFGHVLAHEIAHVLARVDWHAKTGLMQASWNEKDFVAMKFHPLGFAPEDGRWIRESVAREEPVE
jgi:hypothetical protein